MLLAEYLPQSNIMQISNTMIEKVIDDELAKLPPVSTESTFADDNSRSITPIKIPLVSFEPMLATSPNYILVNEVTKKRNQLVVFDDNLEKFMIRFPKDKHILDALWYDKQQHFLILTETNIFVFDPNTKQIELLNDLIPNENKIFKSFTLLNQSTLLIAYNEWGTEYIDKWQQNENNIWQLIDGLPLRLTQNEFIGSIISMKEDDSTNLAITIYNDNTEEWRLELCNTETLIYQKAILLPGKNKIHDYRVISIKDAQSDTKWLAFSAASSNIIAIDSQRKKTQLNYKHPIQRMAIYNENYLIVRTTDKIDIHLFI